MPHDFSIVEYYSQQGRSRCGYCQSPNTSYSHGMTTERLTVQQYQTLIDRGWRRSGYYCYKPTMDITCCPHYTIRCSALEFKMSRSQKKILKRMIKFLNGELSVDEQKTSQNTCDHDIVRCMDVPNQLEITKEIKPSALNMEIASLSEENSSRINSAGNNPELKVSVENKECLDSKTIKEESSEIKHDLKKTSVSESGMILQRKAKLIRIERKRNKLLAQGKTEDEIKVIMLQKKNQNVGKTLEDYFNEISNCKNKLELKLVRTSPKSDDYKNTSRESFEVYKKYQSMIHEDKLSKLTYDKYSRFLVTSPLRDTMPENNLPQGYGSFHEQYWYNGNLIAVAVLDILPFCISSVYFFYDPAYSFLTLGTFSSLREVLLTQQLNKYQPSLKYYYMGYYIHSCPKMRYKAKIKPAKLLCPESYTWCDIDKCLPKLDVSKYSRLNEDITVKDEDGNATADEVLILWNNKVLPFHIFKAFCADQSTEGYVDEFAKLVGKTCLKKMLYCIHSRN
ncbi:arginyl-tRNA--protein transferase 1 [Trichogramma pretiosum]|uniref:arginyl-tRNA--protein transferase 1 n=1 Tax=Trichogramma pretiosum TaxID=7493 RepID=UPI0006C93D1B|nr:arginyl-tRNA--protein transferase 1 [Trichogramma pretiosum]XP_014237022.1 arginyl-tRNA--protein transferase 1 [Trichogramma pretiosum]XP_023315728.1 arginyl-tRNA--protein transferase 1 [Trichogramma pretiosum]